MAAGHRFNWSTRPAYLMACKGHSRPAALFQDAAACCSVSAISSRIRGPDAAGGRQCHTLRTTESKFSTTLTERGRRFLFLHPRFIGILVTLAGRRATRESSLGGLFLVLIARPLRLLTLLANDSAGSLS